MGFFRNIYWKYLNRKTKRYKKQHPFKYSIRFKQIDCYDYTRVSIHIDSSFRCLFELYKLPYIVLKMYWVEIFKDRQELLYDAKYAVEKEQEHIDGIMKILPWERIEKSNSSFPHLQENGVEAELENE